MDFNFRSWFGKLAGFWSVILCLWGVGEKDGKRNDKKSRRMAEGRSRLLSFTASISTSKSGWALVHVYAFHLMKRVQYMRS